MSNALYLSQMKNLSALTGIRFFAALYVFLHHLDGMIPFPVPSFVTYILSQGPIGVNVFFILSGYILTYSYHSEKANFKEFMRRRFVRIYPAYFIGFILCLLVTVPPVKTLILNLTMTQSYMPLSALNWYGSGAWSVSTEFFFYFHFPLIMPIIYNQKKSTLYWLLGLMCTCASIPGLLSNLLNYNWLYVYVLPPARVFEFEAGIIGATLVFKHGFKVKEWVSISSVVLLLIYLIWGRRYQGHTIHNFIIIPTVFLVLISCTYAEKTFFFKWIGSKIVEYLGKVSYGFYIAQLPLLLFLKKLFDAGTIKHTDTYLIPILTAVNLLGSIFLYELIENPIHKKYGKAKRRSNNAWVKCVTITPVTAKSIDDKELL